MMVEGAENSSPMARCIRVGARVTPSPAISVAMVMSNSLATTKDISFYRVSVLKARGLMFCYIQRGPLMVRGIALSAVRTRLCLFSTTLPLRALLAITAFRWLCRSAGLCIRLLARSGWVAVQRAPRSAPLP